jgi:N-acetylglucosaminyldiphosphoundecaprenol N-acetyl-beta-D-mannosaminyltransferase
MHNSKRLVFGGGTLFQDRTSLRSLMYYLAIAKIASMNGVKVELWGNGLGEINSPIGKRLLKKALNRASYIGLRDKHSYEYALSLGVSKEKLFLENDLSHLTLPIDSLRVRDVMRKSNLSEYSPRVLISISGACNALEYKIISDIVMHSKEEGALVVILDMYPSEDSKISEKISEEFGCRRVFGLCAGEIVYLCQNATLCVSMRLHALIFSKLGGCNFIGVGDDPKIRAFCEENGGLFI